MLCLLLVKPEDEGGRKEGGMSRADRQEGLEPSLRIATQRRVTALEADLAAAEKRDVEKKNGAKYHAVSQVTFIQQVPTDGAEGRGRAETEGNLTDRRQ